MLCQGAFRKYCKNKITLMAIFFLMSCSGLAAQVKKVQTSFATWGSVFLRERYIKNVDKPQRILHIEYVVKNKLPFSF